MKDTNLFMFIYYAIVEFSGDASTFRLFLDFLRNLFFCGRQKVFPTTSIINGYFMNRVPNFDNFSGEKRRFLEQTERNFHFKSSWSLRNMLMCVMKGLIKGTESFNIKLSRVPPLRYYMNYLA